MYKTEQFIQVFLDMFRDIQQYSAIFRYIEVHQRHIQALLGRMEP